MYDCRERHKNETQRLVRNRAASILSLSRRFGSEVQRTNRLLLATPRDKLRHVHNAAQGSLITGDREYTAMDEQQLK